MAYIGTAAFPPESVETDEIKNLAITNAKVANDTLAEAKLDISNSATDGDILQYKNSTDQLTWITGTTARNSIGITAGTSTNEKIPTALIPDLAITNVLATVATLALRNSNAAAKSDGDLIIIANDPAGTNDGFYLFVGTNGATTTVAADWIRVNTGTEVDSITGGNGITASSATGAVTLSTQLNGSTLTSGSTGLSVTTPFSTALGTNITNSLKTTDTTLTDTVKSTFRSNIGVDASGTDSSTDVTLAAVTDNYLSLSGQAITSGTVPVVLGGTGSTTASAARTALGVDSSGTDNSTDVSLAAVTDNYLSISGQAVTAGTVPVVLGGTGSTTASAARTALGVDSSGTDNSTNVSLANTNYLSITGQAITGGTVPVASGGTGSTTASAARTALGVDAAGADNSTNVSLANTNYLSITGQAITGGTVPIGSGGTGAITASAARTALGVDASGTDSSTDVTLAAVTDNYLSISGQAVTAGTVPVVLGGTGSTTASAARTALGVDSSGTDNSTNVTLGNTNYLSLSGQAITGGTVPVASGGTGSTTASAARTALGVDSSGTDNSTAVTLGNTNYLSLSGQAITGGTVPVASGGTGAITASAARTALGVDSSGTDNSTAVTLGNTNYLSLSGQAITGGTVPIGSGGTGSTTASAARTALGLKSAATKTAGTAADNVLLLNSSGKVPSGNLDIINLSDVESFTTIALRNASTATIWHKGDIAIITAGDDLGTYIYFGTDQTTAAATLSTAWKVLQTPTDAVSSVNGSTGTVTLDTPSIINNGTSAPTLGTGTGNTAGAIRTAIGVDSSGTDNSTAVTLGNTNYLSLSGQAITGGTVPVASGGTGSTTASAARTALGVDSSGTDNSTNVSLANTNYLSITGQAITGGTVPIGSGGTGSTTASAARTALGVDSSGTDNSTAVTLGNTNYLSLSGQAITGGTVPVASGGTGSTTASAARTALGVDSSGTDNSTDVSLAAVTGNYLSISGQSVTAGTVPVSLGGTGSTTASAARTALGVDSSGTDNSTNVSLANTNYLSLSGQAITGGTVPIGSGGTGSTTASAARTALGVDSSGTDNSTAVTLGNTNYLSITGQAITGGTVPVASGGTGSTTASAARTALGVEPTLSSSNQVSLVQMGSEAVSEAKLQISNAGTNGQILTKQSGNTGGLTWEDAGGGDAYFVSNSDGDVPSAPGTDALAIGEGAIAGGVDAAGNGAIAMGLTAKAEVIGGIAIGPQSKVEGLSGIAIGALAGAGGVSDSFAIAVGVNATAAGSNSTAIGFSAKAPGDNSIAIGNGAQANDDNVIAIGAGAVTKADFSVEYFPDRLDQGTGTPSGSGNWKMCDWDNLDEDDGEFNDLTRSVVVLSERVLTIFIQNKGPVSLGSSTDTDFDQEVALIALMEQIRKGDTLQMTIPAEASVDLDSEAVLNLTLKSKPTYEFAVSVVNLPTGFGTTDEYWRLRVDLSSEQIAGVTNSGQDEITLIKDAAHPMGFKLFRTRDNSVVLGNDDITSISCNAQSISAVSDKRDKARIEDLEDSCGLDFINKIQPREFYWDRRKWYDDGVPDGSKIVEEKSSDIPNSGKQMGFIAQEVEAIIEGNKSLEDSNLVTGKGLHKEMSYGALVTPLVKAVQQLSTENDALKARLDALENP